MLKDEVPMRLPVTQIDYAIYTTDDWGTEVLWGFAVGAVKADFWVHYLVANGKCCSARCEPAAPEVAQ